VGVVFSVDGPPLASPPTSAPEGLRWYDAIELPDGFVTPWAAAAGHCERTCRELAAGLAISPYSTSPWQFAQSRTHLAASARYAAIEFPEPIVMLNDLLSRSTWWKCRFQMQQL